MTTSAPSPMGLWRNGVAKVLSTTTRAPAACAASAPARMSTMFSIGVVGSLERGEAELERRPGRVGGARVVVPLVLADGVLRERRRLVDRDRDGPRSGIGRLPLVDRASLEVHPAAILAAWICSPSCAR